MKRAAEPIERTFTDRDRQCLAHALRSVEAARLFRRLQAILLVADGRRVPEVVSITGLARSSVYHLVRQYLHTHDVRSVADDARTGRPRVATEITDERLLRELRRTPSALGYRTNVWTVELLAEHLSTRYQCCISPRTLRRRMKERGLRCKRPRYVYSEKEPHRAQKKGRLSGS